MDPFLSNKHGVLRARRAIALRWATVTLAAISWLAISNHCALGLAAIESHEATSRLRNTIAARAKSRRSPSPAKDASRPVLQDAASDRGHFGQCRFRRTRRCSPERRLISQCRWWLGRRVRSARRSFSIPDRRAEKRSRSLSCNGACSRTLLLSRPNDLIARSCELLTGRRVKCAREALPSVCISVCSFNAHSFFHVYQLEFPKHCCSCRDRREYLERP